MYLSCKLLLIHSNISWRLRFSEVTLVLNTLTAAIFLQQLKMDGFRHKKQSPVSWKGYSMTNTWQKAFHTKTRPDGWSTKRMGPISEKSPAEWERVWTELWWKMQRVLDKQYYKEGFCVFFFWYALWLLYQTRVNDFKYVLFFVVQFCFLLHIANLFYYCMNCTLFSTSLINSWF